MLRAVIFLVAMSGCSFVLVSGPPANHRELPTFECTTSRLGPGLDTVWTVLQTLNFALAASQSEAEWNAMYDGDPPIARVNWGTRWKTWALTRWWRRCSG